MIKLHNGDCLDIMDNLIEQGVKVDLILADPPYGTTACKWDAVIPLDKMWERLNKLAKERTPIILFSVQPFASQLVSSNIKNYKCEWIWNKKNGSNFLNAKYHPFKIHENVVVFGGKKATNYYPVLEKGKPYKIKKQATMETMGKVERKGSVNDGWRYPRSIQEFTKDSGGYHPTQKPVELLEYLIKTYSNEGDTVLDFTMGSGSTGVACKNTNRNFIGIELDNGYFEIAKQRINNGNR